jgi:hypothetical protein
MGENRFSCSGGSAKENYGIEASRILDACRDRDCFEDVRVFLTAAGDDVIARTGNVRVKCVKIVGSNIMVDQIQFNRGFYTVTVRFFLQCTFEACIPMGQPQEIDGIAVLEKRAVLFGGESNVSVFRSYGSGSFCSVPDSVACDHNTPEAVVEVVQPIVLNCRVKEAREGCNCCCCCCDIPTTVSDTLCGVLNDDDGVERYLTVSLGVFSVIRLVRPGQLLVEATEYCLPDKECCTQSGEDPCCSFRNMPFPISEFCPITTVGSATGLTAANSRRRCGES